MTGVQTCALPIFIITSYLGRNLAAVPELIKLVDLLAIPVFSSCLSTVNIPFNHPMHAGVAFGQPTNPLVGEADVIVMIDTDVPWCILLTHSLAKPANENERRIPLNTQPSETAEIYHIDCDPLKDRMAYHAYPSLIRARADAAIALEQLTDYLSSSSLDSSLISSRREAFIAKHAGNKAKLDALEVPTADGIMTAPMIVASLRSNSPAKTLVLNEAISNYPHVWNHFAPTQPGTLLTSGASSLGWALGAAVGAKLAGDVFEEHAKDLVAVVVGDGSFLFGVPSASYWMARRYETVSSSPFARL